MFVPFGHFHPFFLYFLITLPSPVEVSFEMNHLFSAYVDIVGIFIPSKEKNRTGPQIQPIPFVCYTLKEPKHQTTIFVENSSFQKIAGIRGS